MNIPAITGKTVLVCGASGLSGRAALALCLAAGATKVLASDRKAPTEADPGGTIDVRPREDTDLLDDYNIQVIVTAPGVPLSNSIFKTAAEKQIPILGETDLGARALAINGPGDLFVAITGTDGKSTTTALLAHLITSATDLPARPCGNFGLPLSGLALLSGRAREALVVECSSFQLELVGEFHPRVAVLLNLADDHLDRYPSREEYLQAKLNVLDNMGAEDIGFFPARLLPAARARNGRVRLAELPEIGNEIVYAGEVLGPREIYNRPWAHDRSNLAAALAALGELERAKLVRVDRNRLREALGSFAGLPHRMESLGAIGNTLFINDSKATTVQAVDSALAALSPRPTFLLLGGRMKGGDFSSLARHKHAHFFAFGEASAHIASELGRERRYETLSEAFQAALSARARLADTESEAVVLLSPGCASYDQYGSYAERGEHMRSLVKGLRNHAEAGPE
ncbi:MAG: UDP-N-acetylmuramoyl-L-alanine--D-glutamate ligase [Leptospiraceae bacterium]|nr:UDP-N-acetylmuramoyl-L-alanine--D-glutamate ligase [Leptospiraceae bacterium]